MSPAFDIDGGLPLALARAASVAALLSVSGTLAFRVVVLPKVVGLPATAVATIDRRLLWLTWAGVGAGLLAFLAWLVLQAADMAVATSPASTLAAVPVVLAQTRFGHLVAAQVVLLLATGLAAGRHRAALGLATLALLLQAGHSHAAAMDGGPGVLLVAEIVHLLGAAAWLGGLLPLLLVVQTAPAKAGALAARWFSPMGKLCIVALVASAVVQGWVLVASIPGLVGTAYGWMALGKLDLFGVLFAFAVLNRYRLAPALLRAAPAAAKRALVRSIAVQTGFGLAIVAAAAVLGSLPPAMHAQPVWPFPQMLTLDTVQEDPDFLREVLGALLALGGAAVLLVVAVLLRGRRARWIAVVAAAGIAWFAVPHLDLLFVQAHPTSFYRSPTGFAAASIMQGAALYPQHCALCHGAEGHGDGPAANNSPIPAADLTAAHLWMHSDGELFWWLTHGIDAPLGGMAMPGFGSALSDANRWGLIDFVRAHNAGVVFAGSGTWSPPIPAPGFQAACGGGRTVSPAESMGGFVRLAIGPATSAVPGVITVLATSDPAAKPTPGLCVATDESLPRAYAIVAGLTPAETQGAEFLIDGNGWLRAVQRPGDGPRWSNPVVLQAEIDRLAAYPTQGGNHAHTQM